MRVVVDTGVLISALIYARGPVGKVLELIREGEITPLYNEVTLLELVDVLQRPRFRKKIKIHQDEISFLLRLLRLRGEAVFDAPEIHVCRDPKDDVFIGIALKGQAEVVISGDRDLLDITEYKGIHILSPREFLVYYLGSE